MSFKEYAGHYVGCNPQSVGQEAEMHIAVLEKRIAELEAILDARPQEECTQRLTLQPDGSLRCHHCGHVVPNFESKR